MKLVLKCSIPTMRLKAGETADLPDDYAKRLLATGQAITPADAKAISDAEAVVAKAKAAASSAEEEAKAKRASAIEQSRASAKKASDDAEAARIASAAARHKANLEKAKGEAAT